MNYNNISRIFSRTLILSPQGDAVTKRWRLLPVFQNNQQRHCNAAASTSSSCSTIHSRSGSTTTATSTTTIDHNYLRPSPTRVLNNNTNHNNNGSGRLVSPRCNFSSAAAATAEVTSSSSSSSKRSMRGRPGAGSGDHKKDPIIVTERAADRIKELLSSPNGQDALGIRLGVKRRGCNGLSYTLNYAVERRPHEEEMTAHGVTVFIEPMALFNVVGTVMDYEITDMSSEFTFQNPNSKGSCGCGESFNV